MEKKQKKISRSNLVKKLDTEFSIYIRRRYAKNEIATCVTCNKSDHWTKLQCGHFQSRKHYSTRWDEVNCQVQCIGCNVYKYGEQYKFGLFLNSKYGSNTAENLLRISKQSVKIKDFELVEMIEYYKNKNSIFK